MIPLCKTVDPSLTEKSFPFRIATHPFWILPGELDFFNQLGNHLLSFYQAVNRLYLDPVTAPRWAKYLDAGKPLSVIEYGRMSLFADHLPSVIRPDLILTDPADGMAGMIATELDSIPGGIGLTLEISHLYPDENLIGGQNGMRDGFSNMIRSLTEKPDPSLAIVVSEESQSYFSEMDFLGKVLAEIGLKTFVVPPEALSFSKDGAFVSDCPIDVIYRFFEMFDLNNVPQSEQILQASQNHPIIVTPPPKAYLEEKMLLALFHHPHLKSFWMDKMGQETVSFLGKLFPKTWILDPRADPIPNLVVNGHLLSSFHALANLGQKGRRFVIKPSGFSEMAWGSRGVRIGHDLSSAEWDDTVQMALNNFDTTPHVLQPFHKGRRVKMEYIDDKTNLPVQMYGRVRLSPYYFVQKGGTHLGGILATVCPLDKKLIHGMSDAIMAPCAIGERTDDTL